MDESRTAKPEYRVHSPASDEYRARLAARKATRDDLNAADARYANGRLATFGIAVLIAVLAWRTPLSAWWLAMPIVGFVWLMRRHDLVLRARDGATRAIALYERGLARLEDRWIGTGESGERFRDDRHVYANDLDLFGRGSLFELLSTARTRIGEATLARWLTAPAADGEIRARQQAIAELGPALDLRERLALAGTDVRGAVDTDRLLEWAEMPLQPARLLRTSTWVFTAAVAAAVAYVALTADLVAARHRAAAPGRRVPPASRSDEHDRFRARSRSRRRLRRRRARPPGTRPRRARGPAQEPGSPPVRVRATERTARAAVHRRRAGVAPRSSGCIACRCCTTPSATPCSFRSRSS